MTDPNKNDTQIQDIIDSYFEPKSAWAEQRISRVVHHAAIKPGERLLDLGCAYGTFSFQGKKAGAETVGLDRNSEVLKINRTLLSKFGFTPVQIVCGDGSLLPFKTGSFDAIINADFIEHTTHDTKSLIFNEMYRVLKKGGRGIVYSPNLRRIQWELFGEKIKRLLGLRSVPVPGWREINDPDHFGLTTPMHVKKLLKQAGFNTAAYFYEYHMPLFSKFKFFNVIAKPVSSSQFAFRYLFKVWK